MYENGNRNTLRDSYNRARGKGRLELFFHTLIKKDGLVETLEKALEPYTYEYQRRPRRSVYVLPQKVTGTIGIDRRSCFSKSFFPLPHFNSGDFGYKWANVYGNTHKWLEYPIDCYEFMHRLYVKEGNKRTSVARYLRLPGLKANITRIVPMNLDREDVRCYHEFLAFERETGIGTIWFSYEGAFEKLAGLMTIHAINLEELVATIVYPYMRLSRNSLGPYDAVIDFLESHYSRGLSEKDLEDALRRMIKSTKRDRKRRSGAPRPVTAGKG